MEKKTDVLIFRDCIYAEQALFFFSENLSVPIRYDLQNKDSTVLSYNNRIMYIDLCTYKNGIVYALEESGENLVRYDLATSSCKLIYIGCENHPDGNFAYLCFCNNRILIFTRDLQMLVIYDIVQETVEKISYPSEVSQYYITGCRFKDGYLIFPKDGQDVLEYDALHNQWRIHHLACILENCVHTMASEEDIYMLLTTGKILRWNYKLDKIEVIKNAENIYKNRMAASRLCLTERDIIVLPSLEQDIIRINRDTYETSIYSEYPHDFFYDESRKNWSKYYGYSENSTDYYFACRTSEYILKIAKQSGDISWIKSEIDRSKTDKLYLKRNGFVSEKENDLELFVEENFKQNIENMSINNGKKIWEVVSR